MVYAVHPLWGIAEPIAALSHVLAGLLLLAGGYVLTRRLRDGPRAHSIAVTVYIAGDVSLFLISGIYHWLGPHHPQVSYWWHADHGAIWIGLAGMFTPIFAIQAPRPWRWPLLTTVWSVAVLGVGLEITYLTELPLWVSPLLYVGMGWVGSPCLYIAYRWFNPNFLGILSAGLLATLGGIIDSIQTPTLVAAVLGPHEVMHLLIVAGAALFFRFYYLTLPGGPAAAVASTPSLMTAVPSE